MPIAVLNFFGTYSLNFNNSTVSSHKRKFSVLKLKKIKYKKKRKQYWNRQRKISFSSLTNKNGFFYDKTFNKEKVIWKVQENLILSVLNKN